MNSQVRERKEGLDELMLSASSQVSDLLTVATYCCSGLAASVDDTNNSSSKATNLARLHRDARGPSA